MAVTPNMMLRKLLSEQITNKETSRKNSLENGKDEKEIKETDKFFIIYLSLNLSIPEQKIVAQKMAFPKDEKEAKIVHTWGKELLQILYQQRNEDIIQKALLCAKNLLKSNNKNWEYWTLYGSINEFGLDIYEARKGYDNALELNPSSKALQEHRNMLENYLKMIYDPVKFFRF